MTWQGKLAGKPRIFGIDYVNDTTIPEMPAYETTWAKFPLLITLADMQAPLVQHRERIKAQNPAQVQIAYIAVNHAMPDTQICGRAERDMAPADPFMRFADGSIPQDPSASSPTYGNLYDYRKEAWRTMFFESVRETLVEFDGVFFDNCNVWDVMVEGNNPVVRRELYEALSDALTTLRSRYPEVLLIGNSDIRLPGLNGEFIEDRPQDFKLVVKPYPGHVQPEMNLCQLYSTNEINCKNAYNYVRSKGGWFGAQKQAFDPQWFDWYLP